MVAQLLQAPVLVRKMVDRSLIRPPTDGTEQRLDVLIDTIDALNERLDRIIGQNERPETVKSAPGVREEPLREPIEKPKTTEFKGFSTEKPPSKVGKKS